MGNNKKKIKDVFADLLKECGTWFWVVVVIVGFFSLFLLLSMDMPIEEKKFYEKLIDVVPSVLGFVMTGLSILYGLGDSICKRIAQKANDGNNPFHVVAASFAMTCVALLTTLVFAFIFLNVSIQSPCCKTLCFFLTLWMVEISILSLYNVFFHLFCLRTHFSPLS